MILCAFAFATSCNPKINSTTEATTMSTSTSSSTSVSNNSKAPFKFTTSNYQASALDREGVVVVDFWAAWCGPCRMVDPIIKDLAKEYDGQVLVGKVNVDEEKGIAQRYSIRSIPTILVRAYLINCP